MANTQKGIFSRLMQVSPPSRNAIGDAFEYTRKLMMLYIIGGVAVAVLVPLGILAYYEFNTTLGLFDHLVALILMINLVYIIKTGKIQIPIITGISISGGLFVYLFITGGAHNTGHLWYYTFPLFSAFLLGFKGGAIATGLLFAVAIGFMVINPLNYGFFTTYENDFAIRFIPSFLVVFAYAFTFEKLRKNAQNSLVSKNAELEQAVSALKEKELALGSAQLNLERKVQERTADLARTNAELLSSHERFTTVLDSISANIYVANMDTDDILFMNKHMQEEFGGNFVGQKCFKALRNLDERCSYYPNPKLVDADGTPTEGVIWENFNEMTRKWYFNNDRTIFWVDGRMARLQVSFDVTRRKAAEQALHRAKEELEKRVAERTTELVKKNQLLKTEIQERKKTEEELLQSQERFRQAVDNSPNPIFSVDAERRIRSWNKSCEITFGYPQDVINRPFTFLFGDGENQALADSQLGVAFQGEKLADIELCYKCEDGERRFMVSRVYPVFNKNGRIDHCVFTNTDITERKYAEIESRQAKESAEAANRAKSDFLAHMSHELRTPLNHIIGFTELIVDKRFGELNTKQKKYMINVLQSGQHLLSLVNDILDISKIESGKLQMQPAPVDIKHIMQNSLIMVKEKALKHGIRISLNADGIPKTIMADERKLKQILYNLLANAVKFTSDGGSVKCTASHSGSNGNIEISVSDTGIGIHSADLKRIFDPFEQVENTSSRRFEGTGLGLSLSKQLVELHGGKIWAESDGVGRGAAFRFTIPLMAN
jgi:PAS domain S-box-containing protein